MAKEQIISFFILVLLCSASIAAAPSPSDRAGDVDEVARRGVFASKSADPEDTLGVDMDVWSIGSLGTTAGAGYRATSNFTVYCGTNPKLHRTPLGTRYRAQSCTSSGVILQRCDPAVPSTELCQPSDWGGATTISSGGSQTLNSFTPPARLSATCDANKCVVEVSVIDSNVADTGDLGSLGTDAIADAQGTGNVLDQVTSLANDPDYMAYRRTTGATLASGMLVTSSAAQASGEIIDAEGDYRGQLDFEGYQCSDQCVESHTVTETVNESCLADVPHEKFVCNAVKGTYSCTLEPVVTTSTCTENRPVLLTTCKMRWSSESGTAAPAVVTCSGPTPGSSWSPYGPRLDSVYAHGRLESWRQKFYKAQPWSSASGGSCSAGAGYVVNSECTAFSAALSASTCIQREISVATPTGGTTSSCANDSPGAASCSVTTDTCTSTRQVDVKTCHFEHEMVDPLYVCPTSEYDHDPYDNICTGPPKCNDDYEVTDTGACVLPESQCQTGNVGSGRNALENLVVETVDPSGNTNPGITTVTWKNLGKVIRIYMSQSHSNTHCSPGWRTYIRFTIDNKEELAIARLKKMAFNDSGRILVNGQVFFDDGLDCEGGDGNTYTPNTNILPYLQEGQNVIVMQVSSGPSTATGLLELRFARHCVVNNSTCPAGTERSADGSKCVIKGTPQNTWATEHPDGMEETNLVCEDLHAFDTSAPKKNQYNCGPSTELKTTCNLDAIEAADFESRFNVNKNAAGEIISYDEAYIVEEKIETGVCRPEESGSACQLVSKVCVEPGPKVISGATIERECFKWRKTYDCSGSYSASMCTDKSLPADCSLSGTSCVEHAPDGTCVRSVENYICSTTGASHSCETKPAYVDTCAPPEVTCVETDSAGNCIREVTVERCYVGSPRTCNNKDNCGLTSTTCTKQVDGICVQQKQTYSCNRERQICDQTASVCTSSSTAFGDKFETVAAAYGKVDAILSASNMEPGDIRIFEGQSMECTDSTGGSPFGANCCNTSASGDSWFGDACDREEKHLAGARRGGRAHFVGARCKNWLHIDLGVTEICKCLQTAEAYCVFDSLLGRLVHEQGRPQIDAIAASPPAEVTDQSRSYPYMTAAGGWSVAMAVQGQPLRIYTWNEQCADLNYRLAHPGVACPINDVSWVAYCNGVNCPASELKNPFELSEKTSDWRFTPLDIAGAHGVQIASNAKAGLRCVEDASAPGGYSTCSLTVASWPVGSDHRANVAIDISWQLFRPAGVSGGWTLSERRSGMFGFKPYQIDRGDPYQPPTMPDTIPFKVRTAGGAYNVYSIPTVIPPGGIELPTSPEVTVFGKCDPYRNWCEMSATTKVPIDEMPWSNGGTWHPDCGGGDIQEGDLMCEGFTLQEFMVLDFSKMDLSEYAETVQPEAPTVPINEAFSTSRVNKLKTDLENTNQRHVTGGETQRMMYVTPNEGMPPWTTELIAANTMRVDENQVDVTKVTIDWGDGHVDTRPMTGPNVTIQHQYEESDGYRKFTITATFYLANGMSQNIYADVVSWEDTPTENPSALGGGRGSIRRYESGLTPSGIPSQMLPDPN